jgi:acyl-CoA thioester hydrolase
LRLSCGAASGSRVRGLPGPDTKKETSPRFEQQFRVSWGDLDSNAHMANTAFLDRAADTRMLFYVLRGFPSKRFSEERVGPVILRDELVYRKELRLLDDYVVDLEVVGLSADGVRFQVRNTFRTGAGEVAAIVTSAGVWFDLERRRPRPPPADLEAMFRQAPRGEDFKEIPANPH